MEKKHFHLWENKFYWFAFIVTLLTMAPTSYSKIVWFCMAAIACSTVFFSWMSLKPRYLTRYLREHTKQSVPIILFGVAHSVIYARSFYLMWLPSNKLANLAAHIHLNSKQLLWGIILLAFLFMVCSLFVILSYILDRYQRGKHRIADYAIVLFFSFMLFQQTQGISCGLVNNAGLKHTFCGIMIVVALICFVNMILGNMKASVLVGSLPLLLFSTANYYVFLFRGREIGPNDFLSVGTAMNVVSEYKFVLSPFVLMGWLSWLSMIWAFILTKRESNHKRITPRLVSCAICVLSLCMVFYLEKNTSVQSWMSLGSANNGTILNFFLQVRDNRIKIPENYSPETVQQLERQYCTEPAQKNDRQPAIIVIMDESFTDFRVLGNDVKTEEALIPFVSSLRENTIRGWCYASVYGGNTANSEFEFLTGDSMAFLPAGSVPYQQYLYGEQYTLLKYLHSVGYYCIATHPYLPNGWNRPAVYDYFGFDETSYIYDYPQKDCVRKYVSDQEMFDYVIRKYQDRDQSKGFFLFGITIQNHGGYTTANFESTVPLSYDQPFPEAEQFLSLANISDQAVENLIGYFSQIEEPVVICFFGDHQPRVEPEFLEAVHGGAFDSMDSEMLKYKVPFFIWANYDIDERSDVETSINYLSTYLLEACGLDLPAYNSFLRDTEKRIPILTANGYYSVSNCCFLPVAEATGEEKEALNRYHMLEYCNLFDKEQELNMFKIQLTIE